MQRSIGMTYRHRIPTPNLGLDREQVAQNLFKGFLLFSHLSELLHVAGDFGAEEFLEFFDVHYGSEAKDEESVSWSERYWGWGEVNSRLTLTVVASRMASTKRIRSPRISLERSA